VYADLIITTAAFLAAGGKLTAILRFKLYHPVHDDKKGH